MLKYSELGRDLLAEAILTHIYIWNRCPFSILPNGITPYERVFGQRLQLVTYKSSAPNVSSKYRMRPGPNLTTKPKNVTCWVMRVTPYTLWSMRTKRNSGHIMLSLWKELLTAESKMHPLPLSSQNKNLQTSKK